MSETKLTHAELAQFTGSEQWYRHGLVRNILFTDGAKYVADRAGAYGELSIMWRNWHRGAGLNKLAAFFCYSSAHYFT
jgi:hypothetical protein